MSRKQIRTIYATGTRDLNWPAVASVQKELNAVVKEYWPEDRGYIITGASRQIEAKIVSACKAIKVRVLQAPANFALLTGASAEQLRNADVLRTFSPDVVVIFSKDPLEDDTVLNHLNKLAYKARIPVKVIKKSKR